MNFFLIDTNVWIELLDEKYSKLLEIIIKAYKEEKIRYLIPETLLKEWNKKKSLRIEELSKTANDERKKLARGRSSHLAHIYITEINSVKQKIQFIDELFKGSKKFKVTAKVKADAVDRLSEPKAPFHKERDSMNDALIYLSTVEYLATNRVSEFVFVTRDHTAFSDPNDHDVLNKDLLNESMKCNYYRELGIALKNSLEGIKELTDTGFENNENRYIIEVLPRKETLLDHLYDVLKLIKEKIDFVPLNVLARIEPFRIKNRQYSYSYYSGFKLLTNNDELFELFKSMDIGEKVKFKKEGANMNTAKNIQMATAIIKQLNQNNVYEIAKVQGSEVVYIELKNEKKCDCAVCNYERLNFLRAKKIALQKQKTIEEKFKASYVFFCFGLYDEAAELLLKLYSDMKSARKLLLAYRALYNLYWLKVMAILKPEVRDEIEKIANNESLRNEYHAISVGEPLDEVIATYYYQSHFWNYYVSDISEVCDKIEDHFRLQLNGGFSSNSNYLKLLSKYGEYEMFVRLNGMFFTKFSNHSAILEKFSNALLKVLLLNENQGRKVVLNDYHLIQMVHYSNHGGIVKGFNSLTNSYLKYEPDLKDDFISCIIQFLEKIKKGELGAFKETKNIIAASGANNDFIPFEKHFINALIITAIIDLKQKYLERIAALVYEILINENVRNGSIEYVAWYFGRVSPKLPKTLQLKYLRLFITHSKFHKHDIFESLDFTKNQMIISGDNLYLAIKKYLVEDCPHCKVSHSDELCSIWPFLNGQFKKKIRQDLHKQMELKFDSIKYYYYSINEMIDYSIFYKQYIDSIKQMKENSEGRFLYQSAITHDELSRFLNLTFKYKCALRKEFIDMHKGLSDYYEWILDIYSYDYSKFNPLWILEYSTCFYLEHIFSSAKVKEAVRKYLKNNYQPNLAKYYASYVV